MAERNDDIMQLFTHLGLNPGDYQEIPAPGRVPAGRLVPAATPRPAAAKAVPAAPATVAPAASPRPAAGPAAAQVPAPARPRAASPPPVPVPARVPAATQDSARRWALLDALTEEAPAPVAAPAAAAAPVAAAPVAAAPAPVRELSRAELERESLQSFFEAVREPLPPAAAHPQEDAPTTAQSSSEMRATAHLSDVLSGVPEAAASQIADLMRSRWPTELWSGSAPATPAAAPSGAATPPAAAAAAPEARLRFNYAAGAAATPEPGGPEKIGDVFRRLAGRGT